jgi:hemerythrin-like domain-containing protein
VWHELAPLYERIDPKERKMASRNNSAAKSEIIEELKEDHKRVRQAFRQAEKLDAEEDGEELKEIVDQTCAELEVHAQLEEELFYPAAREVLKEADLVDEAEVEHMSAKALIAQLREMGPEDEKYAATFKVLGEYVNHHIKEEENEMFPGLQGRSGVEWEQVQQQMETRREQLMSEMGLMQEVEEAEDTDAEVEDASEGAGSRSGAARGGRSSSRGGRAEERPQAAGRREKTKK